MLAVLPIWDRRWISAFFAVAILGIGLFGFWPWPTMDLRAGKLALLELVLLASAASMIRAVPLRWFIWWTVAGVVMVYDWRSIVVCWRLLMVALALEAVQTRLNEKGVWWILNIWRALTLVHLEYMLLSQAMGYDPIFTDRLTPELAGLVKVTGFLDNSTIAGAYCAMTLPLFFSGWWKLAIPAVLAGVWFTHSEGAMMVCAILLLILFATYTVRFRFRPFVASWILIVGLFGFGAFQLRAKFMHERGVRGEVVYQAAKQLKNNPAKILTGFGPGQFGREYRKQYRKSPAFNPTLNWDMAHNEPLQALYEFGAIGFLLIAAWILGVGVSSLFGPSLLLPFFMVGLGWLLCSTFTFTAHHAGLVAPGLICAAVLGLKKEDPKCRPSA